MYFYTHSTEIGTCLVVRWTEIRFNSECAFARQNSCLIVLWAQQLVYYSMYACLLFASITHSRSLSFSFTKFAIFPFHSYECIWMFERLQISKHKSNTLSHTHTQFYQCFSINSFRMKCSIAKHTLFSNFVEYNRHECRFIHCSDFFLHSLSSFSLFICFFCMCHFISLMLECVFFRILFRSLSLSLIHYAKLFFPLWFVLSHLIPYSTNWCTLHEHSKENGNSNNLTWFQSSNATEFNSIFCIVTTVNFHRFSSFWYLILSRYHAISRSFSFWNERRSSFPLFLLLLESPSIYYVSTHSR